MELTKKQIVAWRRAMAMNPNIGAMAFLIPDEMVVKYAATFKHLIEFTPEVKAKKKTIVKKCPPHENVITGNRGSYCIDCENYI